MAMADADGRPAPDAELTSLALWTRPAPGSRRPRFTRDEIAATAIRIADAEGFANLTMRRLAAELDAGTMTLYHYVRNKDELLALVMDAVVAEVVVADDELPPGWREALTTIAHRLRAAIQRHPWALDIHDDPAPGPSSLRHTDQCMQAVASLGLTIQEQNELVTAVDEYVYGNCLVERTRHRDGRDEPVPPPEMVDYIAGLVETGSYPTLLAISQEHGLAAAMTEIERSFGDPGRFDRNLQRLLDGFEASWGLGRTRSGRRSG
jgi:AcrR family transcriptional regulator